MSETLPPLPKPITSSKHWDRGLDWPLAGERAVRMEREDQLRQACARIAELERAIISIHRITYPGGRTLDDFMRDMGYANDRARAVLAAPEESLHRESQ